MTSLDTDIIFDLNWRHQQPFIKQWKIKEDAIAHYQHVNNVAYLTRLEKLAWEHSAELGITFEHYQHANRAMVILKHELNYLQACHLDDELACATWIVKTDKKLRLSREFQFINLQTSVTVFTAKTDFVCCTLDSGKPKLMPELFKHVYGEACIN
jgi:acyl-CoA thioester hydrolase